MTNPNGEASIVIIGSYLVALVMDVNRIPIKGETLLARNFREAFGGKGSDMAVQAARLGAPVDFVGCVGDDDFGDYIYRFDIKPVDRSLHRRGITACILDYRWDCVTFGLDRLNSA